MNNLELFYEFIQRHKELYGNVIYKFDENIDNAVQYKDTNINDAMGMYESSISICTKCELSNTRLNFIFGMGDPNADLLLVGEAPSKEDDVEGAPFTGRIGKLLDNILSAIGKNRFKGVYIANILKCKPPKNRDPLLSEVNKCEPYLKNQLKFIKPKLIIALGRIAGKILLQQDIPLEDMRKKTFSYLDIPLRVTYHPAALLNNENLKQLAWDDFQWIRDYIGGNQN